MEARKASRRDTNALFAGDNTRWSEPKTTTKSFVNKTFKGGCEVIYLFVEDNLKDEIGRKLLGNNPIKLKNSTLFERDVYMNCEGTVPE